MNSRIDNTNIEDHAASLGEKAGTDVRRGGTGSFWHEHARKARALHCDTPEARALWDAAYAAAYREANKRY